MGGWGVCVSYAQVLSEIGPLLKKDALIISLAKGIERQSQKTLDEVIPECLPAHISWGLIIGPMLAEEIIQGQGSAGILTGNSAKSLATLSKLIDKHHLTLEFSPDIRGVALAGVLKNIYALALGIADGLGWGANRKGWLTAQALKEMHGICKILGGTKESIDGPAGLGDLIATGSSPHSRNRATGEHIVATGQINPLSEGYISLSSLTARLGKHCTDFKLLNALTQIIGVQILCDDDPGLNLERICCRCGCGEGPASYRLWC